MKTPLPNDDREKIVNEEEQSQPVNTQDRNETTVTAEDIKKGYAEGNKNDSGTPQETADEIKNEDKSEKTTGENAIGK